MLRIAFILGNLAARLSDSEDAARAARLLERKEDLDEFLRVFRYYIEVSSASERPDARPASGGAGNNDADASDPTRTSGNSSDSLKLVCSKVFFTTQYCTILF